MNRLATLSEEPLNEEDSAANCSKKALTWRNWLKNHFPLLFNKKSDLKILLSVLGCPLFPVSVNPEQPFTEVSLFPPLSQLILKHINSRTKGFSDRNLRFCPSFKFCIFKDLQLYQHKFLSSRQLVLFFQGYFYFSKPCCSALIVTFMFAFISWLCEFTISM